VSSPHDLVDQALRSVDDLHKHLRRETSRLVRSQDELALVKATCLAWFNTTRKELEAWDIVADLPSADQGFERLLRLLDKSSLRSTYLSQLKNLRQHLASLRPTALKSKRRSQGPATFEPAPDFTPLVPDQRMQGILVRRWQETVICLQGGASLAATVMMGGVLEGLLLARLNLMPDKGHAFKAKAAPKDKQGKTLALKDWTLQNYIEVAHELGWIGTPARAIGAVLRDWRNFIHPAKEFTEGVSVTQDDAHMFWTVFIQLSKQVLVSARTP